MSKLTDNQLEDLITHIPEFKNENLRKRFMPQLLEEFKSKKGNKLFDDIKKNIIEPILPRHFTDAELESLLDSFPQPNIIFPKIREHNRKEFKRNTKRILSKVVLSPLLYDRFREEIIQTYVSSMVEPGMAPGLVAAESMTQNVTQGTLNSFHQSGAAKTNPVDRFTRLIKAAKAEGSDKKNIYVFFRDPMLTLQDFEKKKREFQMLKIIELVEDYEVETVDELMSRSEYWYDTYNQIFEDRDMRSSYVLRLHLNKKLLTDNRVTLENICEVLRRANEGESDMIKCIKSPATESIIDIYMNDESIYRGKTKKIDLEMVIDQSLRTKSFIDQTLIPSLKRINVLGIDGVRVFIPITEMITNFLSNDEKYKDNLWVININEKYVLKYSFPKERIQYFLKLLDMNLKSYSKERLIVTFTPIDKKETPITRIKKRIGETQEDTDNPINKYNSIIYGYVEGGDYYDIIRRDDVDPLLTHSDNPNEIYSVLGIQAVNNYLNYEFARILGASNTEIPISSRHISIPSLWMTNLGKVTSMTTAKIAEFDEGANTLATIDRPFQTYKRAGIMGSYESAFTVSNAICLGACIPMGTGIVNLEYDEEKAKDLKQKILSGEDIEISISSLKETINDVQGIVPRGRRTTMGIKVKRSVTIQEKEPSSTVIYDVDNSAVKEDRVEVDVKSRMLEEVAEELKEDIKEDIKDDKCKIPGKKATKRKQRKVAMVSTDE